MIHEKVSASETVKVQLIKGTPPQEDVVVATELAKEPQIKIKEETNDDNDND